MSSRSARYRQIVEVLSVHGFGFAVGAVGGAGRFPFRGGLPGHEKGRTYAQPEHLRLALEQLGATFVKFGQILSTRPDVLPPEYVAELAKLQDAVPPVATRAILDVITEELGPQAPLHHVAPVPLAAASIGQVHAARVGQTDVVVKVRRPGVVDTVHVDLEILEDLAERASRHWEAARDHDIAGLCRQFTSTFRNELDYLREGHNAERFAADFAGDPDVHIPAVFWEATSSRVLTLERVTGVKIDDLTALDAAGIDRHALAVRACRVLAAMVFDHGFFHADPHPGNFFVQQDGSLGIIDFGMVGELSEQLREELVTLLLNLTRGDAAGTAQALLDLAGPTQPVDRTALRTALEPLVRTFAGVSLADLGTTQMIGQLLALARRHRLRLPHDLVLLFKTLVMAEGLGQLLDPDFRVATVIAPYAERLAAQRLTPHVVAARMAELLRDVAQGGARGPQTIHDVVHALAHTAEDAHASATELERLVRRVERADNRLVAAVLTGAVMTSLAQIVAAHPLRWSVPRRALAVGAAAAAGALTARVAARSHAIRGR